MADIEADVTPSAARKTPRVALSKGAILTRNERMVLDALGEGQPLKAYELLDRLKSEGVRAPMTVYRALERLENRGLVHKLDGLGAFVACTREEPHALQTFLVCDACASVTEAGLGSGAIGHDAVAALAADSGFAVATAKLEVHGLCAACR